MYILLYKLYFQRGYTIKQTLRYYIIKEYVYYHINYILLYKLYITV